MDYTAHFQFMESIKNNDTEAVLKSIEDENFTTLNPFQWTPLHYAAALKNLELSKEILQQNNECLNIKDKYNRTALSIACIKGCSEIVALLLENEADVSDGLPLCHAISGGNVACVESLIKNGANVNEEDCGEDNRKISPIIVAVMCQNVDVLKILIEHEADVNYGADVHLTPMHWACELGWLDGTKELVQGGAKLNCRCQHNNTPLDYAIINERSDIVEYLLQQDDIAVDSADKFGSTVLHTAVMTEVTDYVSKIIERGADVNAQDDEGCTPLYLAAYNDKINEDVFEMLINNGADVNHCAANSWTALHMCCAVGNLKCVKLILEKATEEGINAVTMENITPLYIASAKGHAEICKELLLHRAYMNIKVNGFRNLCSVYPYIITPDEVIKEGRDAVDIAVLRDNTKILEVFDSHQKNSPGNNMEEIEIINCIKENKLEELGNYSSNISDVDALGWTCLHHAASRNSDCVKECIDLGADVNAVDKYSRTPLTIAAGTGRLDVIELLIENGADPNLGLALFYAIDKNQLDCVKYLLDHGIDLNMRDQKKRSPLHYASIKGNVAIVEQLVTHGADVSLTSGEEDTALHFAAQDGFLDCCNELLKNGADVNAQNMFKETPLILAVIANNTDIVHLLLNNGANVDIVERFENTPLHYASQNEHLECVEEIVKHTSNVNAVNDDHFTPLLNCIDDSIDIFKLLIDNGADPNVRLPDGWSAWHIIACYGSTLFGEEMLKHDTDINALSINSVSPLYIAAAKGNLELVEMLVGSTGCLIDVPVNKLDGVWKNKPFFLRNVPLLPGSTPLIAAVMGGHLETVQYLHSKGAMIDASTEAGMTPLTLAVSRGYYNIFVYLMQKGCQVNLEQKEQLLQLAKENGTFRDQIDAYLSKLDINE